MPALPDQNWYNAHPKAVNASNNFDISIFREGLRISLAAYKSLATELVADLKQNGIAVGNPNLNFRSKEIKGRINTTIQGLINRSSVKHGWHEIKDDIVKDYLFEFAKRCQYNSKRATKAAVKKETPPPQSFLSASPSPLLSHQPLKVSASSSALGTSFIHLATPATWGDSTRSQSSSAGKVHSLESCTLYVTRSESGQTHEDTIDVFLKSASTNSSGRYGPNDYDFSIFKKELTENLSYNEQTDILRYWHSERGFLDVDSDSKWRVALRDLASQPTSGVLNFEVAKKNILGGLRGREVNEMNTQATESSSVHLASTAATLDTRQDVAQTTNSPVPELLVTSPTSANQNTASSPKVRLADQNSILEQPKNDSSQKALLMNPPRNGLAAMQQQLANPKRTRLLGGPSKDSLAARNQLLANSNRKTLPKIFLTPSKPAGNSPWGPPRKSKSNSEPSKHDKSSDEGDSDELQPPIKRRRQMRKKKAGITVVNEIPRSWY